MKARRTLTIGVVPSAILVAVLGERSCQRGSTTNRSVCVGSVETTTVVRGVVERVDLTVRICEILVPWHVSEAGGQDALSPKFGRTHNGDVLVTIHGADYLRTN